MHVFEIRNGSNTPLEVGLRPITGWDEQSVVSAEPGAALALLGRLASDTRGEALPVTDLTVSESDRLLANLYRMLYGDSAECQVACRACGEPYEFKLSLSVLIEAQNLDRPGRPDADGYWSLEDGRRVRAPRQADLEAAPQADALLARLMAAGDPTIDPEAAIGFLERAAPVLSLDLDAPCPHCDSTQLVRFDLARFLIQRLAGERPFLARETHLIASRYGWSHEVILSLTRDDRRAYAGLIEAERTAGPRRSPR